MGKGSDSWIAEAIRRSKTRFRLGYSLWMWIAKETADAVTFGLWSFGMIRILRGGSDHCRDSSEDVVPSLYLGKRRLGRDEASRISLRKGVAENDRAPGRRCASRHREPPETPSRNIAASGPDMD